MPMPLNYLNLKGLTTREQEVMFDMVRGKSNKEIAKDLSISNRTVEIHRLRIMKKTGASNQAELLEIILTEREELENILIESETQFSRFLNALPVIAFIKDEHGQLIFGNKFFEETFGIKGWQDKPGQSLFTPAVTTKISLDDRKAIRAGQLLIEEEVPNAKGERRLYETHKFRIPRGNHSPMLGGIAIDITDRRKTEKALQDSKNHLAESQAIAHLGSWWWDISTGENVWSDEQYRIYGYEVGSIIPNHDVFMNAVIPEDQDRVQKALSAGNFEIEFQIKHPDGSLKYILSRGSVEHDYAGNILVMSGTDLDITELKKFETALLRESEKNKAILKNASDGITIMNDDGNLIEISDSFCNMLGYTHDELIGMNVCQWDVGFNSNAELMAILKQQFLNPTRHQFESKHRRKDGSVYDVEISGFPFVLDGKVALFNSSRDITERKKIESKLNQSEERIRAIADNSSSVMFLKDLSGGYLYINKQYEKLINVTNADVHGKTDYDLFPPKMADAFVANDQLVVQSGQLQEMEEQVQHDDGVHSYLSVKVPVRDATGNIYAVCGIATDITSLKKTEADQRIAATAFESHEAMMITDANRVIVKVNNAFIEETGYLAEEVIGRTPKLLQSGRHDKAFYKAMWETINLTGKWHGEVWDRRKNGEIYPKWLTISAVNDKNGVVTNYIGTQYNITERKLAEEKVQELAFFDPLTHLPNRRLLKDRLKQAMIVSNRDGTYGAVLFIDIDHFKKLNDTLGHDKGDILLQHVAQRLTFCVREGDTVGRLGGDEFLVVLKNLNDGIQESASQIEVVGKKILNALSQTFQLGDINYRSSASIGATLFYGEATLIENLLKQADLAMYKSKDAGRNTLRFFDADMEAVVVKRAALENDLHEALQKNQFLLYYQAQIMDSKLTGCEALVRWQHPQRGLVPPNDFIPLAEETGQIIELGKWVLETACAQLADWASQPSMAHLTIAVNVSAHQFQQENFVDQVLETLKNSNANPYLLKLELTESLLVSNIEDIIEKMYKLKAKGVGFSLDDFGTGFSSLSYLKRMPLNQLKIDQSFVRDVLTDPNDASIAKTIITLADSLNLNVIAEGVETAAQRDFLADAGCFAYQGYFFSRPLPIDEFKKFAKEISVKLEWN